MKSYEFFKGMDSEPRQVPTYRLGDLTVEELDIMQAALEAYYFKCGEAVANSDMIPPHVVEHLRRIAGLFQEVMRTAAQARWDDMSRRLGLK